MIGNQRSGAFHLAEGLHHFVHVHVAIVLERLVKDRQRGTDVAEVDAEDLTPRAEILDHQAQNHASHGRSGPLH